MKLYVARDFPCDPAVVWSLFEEPEFDSRLSADTGVERTILETRTEGAIEVTRAGYRTRSELPRVVARVLGSKHLTYRQVNRFDTDAQRLTWRVELPVLGQRVDVHGITTVEPLPTGCRRTIDGIVSVKIRLVGGQIEKLIVKEFEKSYARAAAIVIAMIRERGLGAG